MTANQILGNSDYPMIAYSGFRGTTRNTEPTIEQIKVDLQLLAGRGYKVLKTFDLQHEFASNVLLAIKELADADENFEMYVILGTWIQCKDAWTENKNHNYVDFVGASSEVNTAIELAKTYPEIVKVISVGNEAMGEWNEWYWVRPSHILSYVNIIKGFIADGILDSDLWVTCSNNYTTWGGSAYYQTDGLKELINAVDYISIHTYPYMSNLNDLPENMDLIKCAVDLAATDFQKVKDYLTSINSDKPVHIGETGWASKASNIFSSISSEENQAAYNNAISKWGRDNNISVCLFSAFDELWKCDWDVNDHENHFGIFNIDRTLKGVGQ